MTNLEYSKNPAFMSACAAADVDATSRQASKYRNQRGRAWNQRGKTRKVKPPVQAQEPDLTPLERAGIELIEDLYDFGGPEATPDESLSGMTVPELRAVCRVRGIKGYSKLRKSELLLLLA